MNKNAIQKYAIWARNELIEQVKQRAYQYGISETGYGDEHATVVAGRVLSADEKHQRHAFVEEIKQSSYKQVVEEVAYTWFNRFVALRYMEVNDYLPTHIRVFSDAGGNFNPEILANVLHLDLQGLDKAKVSTLLNANATEELYRYLLLTQCNALNELLPEMFERMGAYTEMLLPNNILKPESVIGRLVNDIPEEDFRDAVQIIGWLYQYYNTEPKQAVFDGLKKNVKITKETIPAATQLFTPDWIARYMVENSLGRLWYEGHPDETLKSNWKYYLDEADQEEAVQARLDQIREEYKNLKPEEIKCIDPCMGSGHILVYMFDVLMQIYESNGYNPRDAAVSIVENNLYGLDIDKRAAQLAYFAVMMKARQYDRRFLSRGIKPHIYAIGESNGITTAPMHDMGLNLTEKEYELAVKQTMQLVEEMHDAKEYGSLLNITPCDWDLLRRFAVPRNVSGQMMIDIHGEQEASRRLQHLIDIGEAMEQKYDVVVTNPPYMGNKGLNSKLSEYLKTNYTDYKSDTFSAFIVRCGEMAKLTGFVGMFSPYVWMFIKSYEKLRNLLYTTKEIITLIQFEYSAFEEATVPVCTFVVRNGKTGATGEYLRLVDYRGGMEVQRVKTLEAIANPQCGYRYTANAENFEKIPGCPVAYWVSNQILSVFEKENKVFDIAKPRVGQNTGDNERFLRLWHEVSNTKIGFNTPHSKIDEQPFKWIPYSKGGPYRKWYGNYFYLINWSDNGREIKEYAVVRNNGKHWSRYIQNLDFLCCEGVTWSDISSSKFSCRYLPQGFICDVKGSSAYPHHSVLPIYMATLNSMFAEECLRILAPTISFQTGDISRIPFPSDSEKFPIIHKLASDCVMHSKSDWDAFETSWDYKRHPLLCSVRTVNASFDKWEHETAERFDTIKANEEELNRIFIDIYGLQDELTPEVEEKDVTVRRANLEREIRSLISYAVGCMFGRYSLDCEGLAYAGGEWSEAKYHTFPADKDNIIPICDDEYFDDDIVGRFVDFIESVYGADTLEENLKFIADALGSNGTPREVIRNYFLKDFFKDHLKIYQKRPIYWLFDSGKKHGFKALIYMHRYTPDLIAKLRTDYVHEQQERYRTQLSHIISELNTASGAERAKLLKQQDKLTEQLREITTFEEKVHHLADQNISIDLDDGVKQNYKLFADVLAKI